MADQHKNYSKGIYCFTDDLRFQDNIALANTIAQCDEIAFIYILDPRWFQKTNYQHTWIGQAKWQFIKQSLSCLNQQLAEHGHQLTLLHGNVEHVLCELIRENNVNFVGFATLVGSNEQVLWAELATKCADTHFASANNSIMYLGERLNLKHEYLTSFSRFRRFVEKQQIKIEQPRKIHLDALPSRLTLQNQPSFSKALTALPYFISGDVQDVQTHDSFFGGEKSAVQHCKQYFASSAASNYKTTRNALDGWQNSTKFSPYLANGNVSARQIMQWLKQFELAHGASESTYWIYFELLWREYFHHLANSLGNTLYRFSGLAPCAPSTSFYAERFNKWCNGNTPYPIVNACMKQLNQTGFMSNRGRQLVASYLVNELGIDWRYGAAYFQQQLIDHDIASNWGNWQYIAGVGVDPRGGRHFNLQKQTSLYDPEHTFINKWHGQLCDARLDSTDMVDWPIDWSKKED
ncbi:DASH family cryptochrome [Thalassotalea marina]|uniref:Cryptochrome DASH n=1 Tax=Thalassotalea marina TaxID=1673741 RepID=A0A919ELD2_9GAMM|nr:DASH family cryptochrome [Thalassotalea marina]GHF95315.1 cryptochrome DASH [Thalassotalea marina]